MSDAFGSDGYAPGTITGIGPTGDPRKGYQSTGQSPFTTGPYGKQPIGAAVGYRPGEAPRADPSAYDIYSPGSGAALKQAVQMQQTSAGGRSGNPMQGEDKSGITAPTPVATAASPEEFNQLKSQFMRVASGRGDMFGSGFMG